MNLKLPISRLLLESVLGAEFATCDDVRIRFLRIRCSSRSRHSLTSLGRSQDECGTIEGSGLRPTRLVGVAREREMRPPDRLFEGGRTVLHVMERQIA